MIKPNITLRTSERIIRAAYELEHIASRLRAAGFEYSANSIKDVSSDLGHVGRDLEERLMGEKRS